MVLIPKNGNNLGSCKFKSSSLKNKPNLSKGDSRPSIFDSIKDKEERLKMFKWLEELEYNLLELPRPDIKIFLHMPYEYSKELQKNRSELDELEKSEENLRNAENAYLELVDLYGFININCIKDDKIRSIDDISEEIEKRIIELL